MKKIIKLLPILLLVFAFSCGDDDFSENFTTDDPTTGWVEFATPNAGTTISAATETLSLPVSLRVPVYKDGLNVSYTIQAVEGDYTSILTTDDTLTFTPDPSGANGNTRVKSIDLHFENVADLTDLVVFDVVLTAVDVNGVSIGVDDESITSYRVSTPCPIIIADSYNVDVSALGGAAPSHTVDFTLVGPNQYSLASTWGPNFVGWATGDDSFNGQYPYPGFIIVNDDLTVDLISDDPLSPDGGTGTYDSCNDVFIITLTQGVFTTDFTVDLVMTAAE
ncbi:hypothetical protein [Winogradskyella sp.]|uniref:hypothetical protein n=1 Tax=Winogradskyella sp. TaxID=1883156 RepID=UPI003AB7B48B